MSALTYIDNRLTDVIFFSVAAIERILDQESLVDPVDTLEGKLIRWLQAGQIAFDRAGGLGKAQRKVQSGQRLRTAGAGEIYADLVWRQLQRPADPSHVVLARSGLPLGGGLPSALPAHRSVG